MWKWFKSLFQLSPMKEESDLGAPVPVLKHEDNPFWDDRKEKQ